MTDIQESKQEKSGASESFVQHFEVNGLFGYRSISLDSEYAATILIARNGAGKTTMLGALDAFLRCQFGRLADLNFTHIECKLRGVKEKLILKKPELEQLIAVANEDLSIQRLAKTYEIDLADLQFFILWEFDILVKNRQELIRHPVFFKVYQHTSNTVESTEKVFRAISSSISESASPIIGLRDTVAQALFGIDIVYLPTYRRIELSLPEQEEPRAYRRTPISIQARLGLTKRGIHAGDIQFGLSDISARLKQLHQEIMAESNQKYAEISANIIDDLISGEFENRNPSLDDRPSSTELAVFFERMRDVRNDRYLGPYSRLNRIPDFSQIYSGKVPEKSEKFLTYFLGKLNSVIQKTKITEKLVEDFVSNCNRYLSAEDLTTAREGVANVDDKELQLDRTSLEVSVQSKRRNTPIPLDALSSGEKQMISLFSRLYLYPNKKIILIDEPELSLSLDWQRKILPDILGASLCKQVIAITHSPFIFDNELDIFAKAIKVEISDEISDEACVNED